MQIVFTIEQVQQMLTALGEVPSKYSINLIDFIKRIAEPQVSQQQAEQPTADTTAEPVSE